MVPKITYQSLKEKRFFWSKDNQIHAFCVQCFDIEDQEVKIEFKWARKH